MSNWSENEFMSKWDKQYVSTNLRDRAKPYDRSLLLNWHSDLVTEGLSTCSHAIIAAICCAVGRADLVGKFFDDLTEQASPAESEKIFLDIREAITIIFPYLGMPTCIPACYGMIGVVQRKGKEFASTRVLRKETVDEEDARKGKELRARIYHGVGNSGIFDLMNVYFTDLFTCSTVVTWGYLISKANEEVFQLEHSHLIVASAIMALGATRQTKSHIKATLGLGNSVKSVKAVVRVAGELAAWADRPLEAVDVDALSAEIQKSLRKS